MKHPAGYSTVRPALSSWVIGLVLLGGASWSGGASHGRPSAGIAPRNVNWPQISLSLAASGLAAPVHVTHAGDGSGRLFVVERAGRIRIVRNGAVLPAAFLDIATRVLSTGGEQGLLSVAFPPGYAAKRYFYVYYTGQPSGGTVVSRFHTTADPDVADPGSEEVVLTVAQPFINHNGGQLAFGPQDGCLYIGLGDGGSGGDPQNNAQNLLSLLGKILRLDVESGTAPYAIPADNPFAGTPSARPEIWAFGLRNPWRFSFDRRTGDLYIGDVGQSAWEEVDFQAAAGGGGRNYGWRLMEGAHCYNPAACNPAGLTLPVWEYDHTQGCSITGGFVYRGSLHDGMSGIYFFADYCSGMIWGLRQAGSSWESGPLLDTALNPSSFGEDESGELYLASLNGSIYRIDGPSCHDRAGIGNGTLLAGENLRGAGNDLYQYGCIDWPEDGEDRSYQVILDAPASFHAFLNAASAGSDPDLFVLTSCYDSADCLGFGDTEVIFGELPAGTYYVLVDNGSPPGADSVYDLGVEWGAPLRYGDLNLDGRVDAADFVLLSVYLADSVTVLPSGPEAADVAHDGTVDVVDLSGMAGYLASNQPRLPLWDTK